jgi:hypothetical protein
VPNGGSLVYILLVIILIIVLISLINGLTL